MPQPIQCYITHQHVFDDCTHLCVGARVPDDLAALDLGDLSDEAADGAGRPVHHDRLARLGPAQLQQPEVSSVPGHAAAADQVG